MDSSIHREQMEVNYFGTLHAVEAVAPSMIERRTGTIVGLSSVVGLLGVFGYSAYAPSKFAVRGLLECLRAEFAPYGVLVKCVFAGDVDTPQLEFERPIKPPESTAISGTVKTISPDLVASAIVKGISLNRFAVIPDLQTRVMARGLSLVDGTLNRVFDRRVERVQKKQRTPGSPTKH